MNVPGSPSSALQTRYFWSPGAAAPAEPRRLDLPDDLPGRDRHRLPDRLAGPVRREEHRPLLPQVVRHHRPDERVTVAPVADLAHELRRVEVRRKLGDDLASPIGVEVRDRHLVHERGGRLVGESDAGGAHQGELPVRRRLTDPDPERRLEGLPDGVVSGQAIDRVVAQADDDLPERFLREERVERDESVHLHPGDAEFVGDRVDRHLRHAAELLLNAFRDREQPRAVPAVGFAEFRNDRVQSRTHVLPPASSPGSNTGSRSRFQPLNKCAAVLPRRVEPRSERLRLPSPVPPSRRAPARSAR